ncbi:hypothetical protein B0I35DRAFT_484417 [Stachybotrys elegans]|uniref:Uncharacterized protein n=1 Tax=Stachybotrys elegans TaxID=80388 RepID=A0A8K0SCW1_9HYPO|nr:hypothetical protein B0I35DRAFT_484417 [Stachybotrys elegans]
MEHKDKVEAAYHTELFQQFIKCAVANICATIGLDGDPYDWWDVRCVLEESTEKVLSHYYELEARKYINQNNFLIEAGQVFEFFRSHKSLPQDMRQILRKLKLVSEEWKAEGSESFIYLVTKRKGSLHKLSQAARDAWRAPQQLLQRFTLCKAVKGIQGK